MRDNTQWTTVMCIGYGIIGPYRYIIFRDYLIGWSAIHLLFYSYPSHLVLVLMWTKYGSKSVEPLYISYHGMPFHYDMYITDNISVTKQLLREYVLLTHYNQVVMFTAEWTGASWINQIAHASFEAAANGSEPSIESPAFYRWDTVSQVIVAWETLMWKMWLIPCTGNSKNHGSI